MALTIQQISPVAHLPLVLGVVRKLNVAALIDTFCPPHPAHILSCDRGVEALLLAILDGHDALNQVLLSLGVSSDGLPLRVGIRDGNTSDSIETPVAIEECLALGLDGVRGIVADSKAYCKRTLGLCLEKRVGLITLVPRTCAVRQELETWGQQQGALPLLLEKPGRARQKPLRRWHGQSVTRLVAVEYADGR